MANKGPMPKHPSKRQRRNKPDPNLAVVPSVGIEMPAPERQWFAVTKKAWKAFWESDVSAIVTEEDVFALRRLFNLRDDHERLSRSARKNPMVLGSMNQMVENPASKRADRIMGQITTLEDRFGLNPVSRLRLLASTADIQRTVDDLNKDIGEIDDLQVL